MYRSSLRIWMSALRVSTSPPAPSSAEESLARPGAAKNNVAAIAPQRRRVDTLDMGISPEICLRKCSMYRVRPRNPRRCAPAHIGLSWFVKCVPSSSISQIRANMTIRRFIPVFLGAMTALAAMQAQAQDMTPRQESENFVRRVLGSMPGDKPATACFVRTYDAAHLAAHPQQKVRQVMFLFRASEMHDDNFVSYTFITGFRVKGRTGASIRPQLQSRASRRRRPDYASQLQCRLRWRRRACRSRGRQQVDPHADGQWHERRTRGDTDESGRATPADRPSSRCG